MTSFGLGSRGRSFGIALLLTSVALVALFAGVPSVRGQSPNYIAGNACVSGPDPKWQNGDTWILYGNVTVPVGCTLTIEPGATVKADPDVHLYVHGALIAGGTPGTPSEFLDNQTAGMPWAGIQFNATATGSVTWSDFQRVIIAVAAQSSSPAINNNTILQAGAGVRLDSSNSLVADNLIDGRKAGSFGIIAASSTSTITRNRINGTTMGLQASVAGSLTVTENTITNVSGAVAIGIYVTNLASVNITGNTFDGGLGVSGAPGGIGGTAAAVLVNGTPSVTIVGNLVSTYHGGRGGAGPSPGIGSGSAGGPGGAAAGIGVGSASSVMIQGNTVDEVTGGRGGPGGDSSALGNGGPGGRGGDALGIEVFSASASASYLANSVTNVTGGDGGDGGQPSGPSFTNGNGGPGGSAYGLFSLQAMNPDLSSNIVRFLRGGAGGNTSTVLAGGTGGLGGETNGIVAIADGSVLIHANTVTSLNGGLGGSGVANGNRGGNATALLIIGDGNAFNSTMVSYNQISSVTGGFGGIGGKLSGDGGTAGAIVPIHVAAALTWNAVSTVNGGNGGEAYILSNQASRGGDAAGASFFMDTTAASTSDTIVSVTRGAHGTGATPAASNAAGFYFAGNATITTRASVTNVSLAAVGDFDLYVDNYTEAVTLNTPFRTVAVQSAGNLTVRNFLAVNVFWPNGVTPIWGARITVTDNGVEAYNRTATFGVASWIVVTNRVYVDRSTPAWNVTRVTARYQTYLFSNNSRIVNMTQSQTQNFTMVDTTAPSSSVLALSPWTNVRTFPVTFGSSDGFGVGVANVTLWYRLNGTVWIEYGSTSFLILGFGQFSFTAPADGLYEFATTAIDKDGNAQQPTPPTANNTWTIVDTTKPASHVDALSVWEASLSFPVIWGPDAGTTDIASYTVQYNTGVGWTNWLVNTTLTSGSFSAVTQGVYAFRTIARDLAGNVEVKAGNDTWTIVDTVAPGSVVTALPAYETTSAFGLAWGPWAGTTDIESYAVQVSEDGGSWATWFSGATNRSATFTGADGHRYAFRSLATDYAGNTESKGSTNDTWTSVDLTPPASAVGALPRYETSLTFSLSWGPVAGTTDIATYTVEVSDDGGSWTPLTGSVNTPSRTATFTGLDGHAYGFRSLATDHAANAEAKSGNDTYTTLDVTHPSVVSGVPQGAGADMRPAITVTFSERMDPASTQSAFSLTPTIDGDYTWNAAGTQLTFTPSRDLQAGTSYTVIIDTSAKDAAGNNLASVKTFTFTTAAGLEFTSLWPLFLALAAIAVAAVILLMRRRGAAAETAKATPATPSPATQIDDVFLLYRDGVLIKHETLRLRPDIDTDILSGMLTAVQQFVKDSFQGDEEGELNEITVGQMHLHLGRGKWLILAARVSGGDVTTMNDQIKKCIEDLEMHHWDQLEEWDGDMAIAKVLGPYLKRLIRGEYA